MQIGRGDARRERAATGVCCSETDVASLSRHATSAAAAAAADVSFSYRLCQTVGLDC